MATNDIQPLTIKDLFSGKHKYLIPIYQRNFAWGETEISQMIQDIADYADNTHTADGSRISYYIGSLVVANRGSSSQAIFETIDGQQRLTTLTILLNVIKHNNSELETQMKEWLHLNLEFESRPVSTDTLQAIFQSEPNEDRNYNSDIVQAYYDALKALKRILKEKKLDEKQFCDYLFNHVVILRVTVPDDTDLNHYFEIMNNRGEQLEKHEIIKARLIEFLKDDKSAFKTFNLIWEACSNMEKYVQYGFDMNGRHSIFGYANWNMFDAKDFDDIKGRLYSHSKDTKSENTIEYSIEFLTNESIEFKKNEEDTDEGNERFYSPVNFPNFLLHILRIQTKKDIQLDDKQLIPVFERMYKSLSKEDAIEFVKQFAFNLLKGRFLFDKYVIKRELKGETERWSLKQLNCRPQRGSFSGYYVQTFGQEDESDGTNANIIMLLSMFHVSHPTMIYKHWLNGALKCVFENKNTNAENYILFMEKLAKAYLLNRYIVDEPLDYFDIIYKNNGTPIDIKVNYTLLDRGTSVENFVFNYLDYILWLKDRNSNKEFEFTFKSSVEHYYPQNPVLSSNRLDQKNLNMFGNLCLLSRSKNSKLSNSMPNQKKEHYDSPDATIDSIKQKIMLKYPVWNISEIEGHGNTMKRILFEDQLTDQIEIS